MSITLYTASIPPLISALKNLSVVLKKAEAYADEKGISHSTFLETKLIDDMQSLPYQVQRASDGCKGVAVRVGGLESVAMADDETTFDQLQARITKTIDVLNKVKPEDMNGKEEKEVILKTPKAEMKFTAFTYLTTFVLPNVYFHCTVAYSLVRMQGAPVGKMTFLKGGDPL